LLQGSSTTNLKLARAKVCVILVISLFLHCIFSQLFIYSAIQPQVCNKLSVVSVMSCRSPNSITTTCRLLVADLLATRRTILTYQDSSPCR